MSKKDTINTVFGQLVAAGAIRNKKDFADLLGVNYSVLVSAMNGNERFLTDNLIAKAEYLTKLHTEGPERTGEAPKTEQQGVFLPPETLQFYTNLSETVKHLSAVVDRLTAEKGAFIAGDDVYRDYGLVKTK